MGHGSAPHPRPVVSQPVGENYRLIALTQGKVAKVSADAYEWISRYTWCVRKTKKYYACRGQRPGSNIFMHRQILGLEQGDPRWVDHINGDTLDNRNENLRICDKTQNACNKKTRSIESCMKGVGRHNGGWRARIGTKGKNVHLGVFATAAEAAQAYDDAARKYQGEYACTNYPPP